MGELRKDPVSSRWVIIATERSKRPGSYTIKKPENVDSNIDKCPFCYGNEKMTPPESFSIREDNSKADKKGWKVRVVPNKYPALSHDKSAQEFESGLFDMRDSFGTHEVVIETPDHYKEINEQTPQEVLNWVETIQKRVKTLYEDDRFMYLLVFKNKGVEAGASLRHPHHQIIATPVTPKRVKEELEGSKKYFQKHSRCIFCDMISQEIEQGKRIVYENDNFISFTPYASRFPFETWILPKFHCIDFHDDKVVEKNKELVDVLQTTLKKLYKVLGNPEYNYLIHSAPNRIVKNEHWKTINDDFHWHIELFPRLVRTAGFEWGTGFYINPTSPEEAAKALREA